MELGYLTARGHPVVIDTIGLRTIFPAYRVDERALTCEFLGLPEPLTPISDVRLSVALHRQGWGSPGEPFVRPVEARLYRHRMGYMLLGRTWKAIRAARRGDRTHVRRPLGASLPKVTKVRGIAPPPRDAPLVGFLEDGAVKGCERSGPGVTLRAVERKEFTDFVIGKLTATLEFPTEDAAETFARGFPVAGDLGALDASVTMDIDRRRGIVRNRRSIGIVALAVGLYALGIGLATYVYATGRYDDLLRALGGLWGLSVLLAWYLPDILWNLRRELLDLVAKWEEVPARRWVEHAEAHAARFVEAMRARGVDVTPDLEGLATLDRFFRGLPPDTYLPAFARDAGGLIGAAFMAHLDADLPHEWRYLPDARNEVLWIGGIEFWVAPSVVLAKIWEGKQVETLDRRARDQVRLIDVRLAFRDLVPFAALGYLPRGWDRFESVAERILADAKRGRSRGFERQGSRFLVTTANHGPFQVRLIEGQIRRGGRKEFTPLVAIPFCTKTQTVRARLDPAFPHDTERPDVAVVRLDGRDEPVAVLIHNYLEALPDLPHLTDSFDLDLLAVADRIQITRDGGPGRFSPAGTGPDGPPAPPWTSVRGRITSAASFVNPFDQTPFWELLLDVSGFPLQVVVRQDACDGEPEGGRIAEGACWLAARFPAEEGDEEEGSDGAGEREDELEDGDGDDS